MFQFFIFCEFEKLNISIVLAK